MKLIESKAEYIPQEEGIWEDIMSKPSKFD